MQELMEPLRPVHPVVAALKWRAQQRRIVPGVYRQTRQTKRVVVHVGAAENRRDSVFKAVIRERVEKIPREVSILLREGERVRERRNRSAQFLLDGFLGIAELVIDLLGPQGPQVRVCNRVRTELNSLGVQFADLAPGEI